MLKFKGNYNFILRLLHVNCHIAAAKLDVNFRVCRTKNESEYMKMPLLLVIKIDLIFE